MTSTTPVHVPETSKTAVITEDAKLEVREVPTQVAGENEVLVKVAAIGINPTDWKLVRSGTKAGNYAGCDLAGVIVKIGPNPKVNFNIGDRVSASILGNASTERGAFSEYAKAFADLVWKIPEAFSFEEAVTTGIPLNTAFQALYSPFTLELIQPGAAPPPEEDTWIFVYGGSSAVGQYTVQLAKLSGYKVATVASPRNHELLKTLGADLVFDYHDPEVVGKLKEGSGDKIHLAVDTISEPATQATTVRVLAENKPGKVIVILSPAKEAQEIRKDVDVIVTVAVTAYGVNIRHAAVGTPPITINDTERGLLSDFLQKLVPDLVRAGKLKPNAIKLWNGGLEKVDEGLTYLQSGKASAEKVVFKLY